MAQLKFMCFQCGKEIVTSQMPGRRDECSSCGADVHVCRNCKFYDVSAYNECREPSAEVVREKDRANFCDFFQPGGAGGDSRVSPNDLMAAAEALFKKNRN